LSFPGRCLQRFALVCCLCAAIVHPLFCQPARRPLPLSQQDALEVKNFYLLSLLEKDSQVRTHLSADQELAAIVLERKHSMERAAKTCGDDVTCMLKPFLWTDEEIDATARSLARVYRQDSSLRHIVEGDLRQSGAYVLYEQEGGSELVADAWEICAHGLNNIIEVYGDGAPPRYPHIDSISFDTHSADFEQRIAAATSRAAAADSGEDLFFGPSLRVALELLLMNHRDEAGRLEPMERGANAAAVKAIPGIQWKKYAYSVIVVPGAGPSDPNVPLDPMGRRRTELAAEAWRAGKAPLILVSGGFVHPSQTRFSEALEMKKALLGEFHVPEADILVDPHARHTTTNMRNAVREIYRYGIPMDKPALVVSDAAQIAYIASPGLAERCLKELGYVPYRITAHTDPDTLVFDPLPASLEQDPMDPLDP